MIVNQGYPLWLVHDHGNQDRRVETVTAWRWDSEESEPLPVTAECGPLTDAGRLGGYLSTEAERAKAESILDRAKLGAHERDLQKRRPPA
jgi:hypothetical protein